MQPLRELIDNNRAWSEGIRKKDPDFFPRLARLQSPKYLWVGCSDSRVPANEIVGLAPGELFVHRNVANVVVHTDLNFLSVLQYAVEVLKVRHVIVCGHYGCGGVKAALHKARHGLIDNWLRHIQDVVERHRSELDVIADVTRREDRLCELNVLEQVVNVCQTTVITDAWTNKQRVDVHGWVYGLKDGLLRDLGVSVAGPSEVPSHIAAARDGRLGKRRPPAARRSVKR